MSVGRRRALAATSSPSIVVDGLSLKEWLTRYIDEHEARHLADGHRDETAIRAAVTSAQHALEAALEAVRHEDQLHREAHARDHEAHERSHTAERIALDKAEAAMTIRLAGMNEIRAQLSDQAALFVTKEAFDARRETVDGKFAGAEREMRAAIEANRARIETLEKTTVRSEGKGAGLATGWGYLVAVIGLIVVLVNFGFFLVTR